jgi:hypothetical protein
MVKVRATEAERPPRRHTTDPTQERTLAAMRSSVRRTATTQSCEDCRAATAFQLWHDQDLSPSFNWEIDFSDEIDISAGHRAVIELVTATIIVPAGNGLDCECIRA